MTYRSEMELTWALATRMIMLCATFVKCIVEEQQQSLLETLCDVKFFSVQADGTTDTGNVEDELFALLYFNPKMDDCQVHVQNRFLTVRQVKRADSHGPFQCFKAAMECVRVNN